MSQTQEQTHIRIDAFVARWQAKNKSNTISVLSTQEVANLPFTEIKHNCACPWMTIQSGQVSKFQVHTAQCLQHT